MNLGNIRKVEKWIQSGRREVTEQKETPQKERRKQLYRE